jgi:hypothetical protein
MRQALVKGKPLAFGGALPETNAARRRQSSGLVVFVDEALIRNVE